jgi:hypothetical protein
MAKTKATVNEAATPPLLNLSSERIVHVELDKIVLPPGCVIDREDIERIKISITGTESMPGCLLQPITIRAANNEIIGGVHRYMAFKELERPTIPAVFIDCSEDQAQLLRLQENISRREITHAERMAGVKLIKKLFVNSAGNPDLISDDSDELEASTGNPAPISQNFEKLEISTKIKGAHLEDLVVEYGLFDNRGTFYHALKVNKECIPEVFELINKRLMTYSFAATEIAGQIDKKEQKTKLHTIAQIPKAGLNPKGLKKEIRNRLQRARLSKSGTPQSWRPCAEHERYLVARAFPDWNTEKLEDLKLIPVGDYVADNGVLCIVVPNPHVDKAFKLMEHWGFHYEALFLLDHGAKQIDRDTMRYQLDRSLITIIGLHNTRGKVFKTNVKAFPREMHENIEDYALTCIDDLFRNDLSECKLLDVCATKPNNGWESLKDKFGR